MIRVFIGYDDNEKVAFSVLSHSLLKHSTQPIAITPIRLQNIKKMLLVLYINTSLNGMVFL